MSLRRFLLLLPPLSVLASTAAEPARAQPLPAGPEIQVNTYTRGLQRAGGVASDSEGAVPLLGNFNGI